jgi:hypothetical protein
MLLSKGLPGLSDFVHMFSGVGAVAAGETESVHEGERAAMPGLNEPVVGSGALSAVIPDDADVLGLFASPGATNAGADDAGQARPDEDLLALLAVGGAPVPAASGADAAPKDDDILALFDAKEDPVLPESEQETMPSHPDILDMFGPSNAKPDFDKTR